MDFLGFTLSVWTAIAFGVFFLVMVGACTADRHDREGFKWGTLFIGLVAVAIWQWDQLSWGFFLSAAFWKAVGIYAGIGLAYSVIEFWFKIRREAREWGKAWQRFQDQHARSVVETSETSPTITNARMFKPKPEEDVSLESRFLKEWSGRELSNGGRNRIVKIELDQAGKLVPIVNRRELAESIGCWTLFWPGYAVSLVLGDLLTEVFRRLADLLAVLSRGFVRRAFSNTFRP